MVGTQQTHPLVLLELAELLADTLSAQTAPTRMALETTPTELSLALETKSTHTPAYGLQKDPGLLTVVWTAFAE